MTPRLEIGKTYTTRSGKKALIFHATRNKYKYLGDNKRWYYYNGTAVIGKDDIILESGV